jgi:sortase (surface protein transpeptidase)
MTSYTYSYVNLATYNGYVNQARARNPFVRIASWLAKLGVLAGFAFLFYAYGASVYYALTGGTNRVTAGITQVAGEANSEIEPVKKSEYQPRVDNTLPFGNWLVIPSIGVKTEINEGSVDQLDKLLRKGVWRVNDYGTPFHRETATIVAAHRYGYLNWTNQFRRENSFFNLPKLKVGDKVSIYWDQREYVYEIYAEAKGSEIQDYSADLILYTCELLNSPVRIFKYARLLEV